MALGLKIAIFGITLYAGIRFMGLGIAWLKEFFDQLKPNRRDKYRF